MNFSSILYINGLLICVLAISMIIPMSVDLYMQHSDWKVFFLCMILSLFFGGALILSNHSKLNNLTRRDAFLVIVTCWLVAGLLGTLPFMFSESDMTFSQAFFESVSGITTTGATMVIDIDAAPPGILIWRALLQWLGGIGTIIMAATILPFLSIGGMQLFRTDQTDSERALPRTFDTIGILALIYLIMTLSCATLYSLAGMTRLDAAAHAMSTISLGGFSTHEMSFGHFENLSLEIIAVFFMIAGSLPYVLILKSLRGDWPSLFFDQQIHTFLLILLGSCILVCSYLFFYIEITPIDALRSGIFQTVSIMTGAGFSTANYNVWGSFILGFFFFLMAIGGCACSASGGIKVFRIQIFFSLIRQHIQKLVYPNAVTISSYNKKPIPEDVPVSVLCFLFIYALAFVILALALSLTGADVMTALSGATASLSNTGLGMGDIIGPAGDYRALSDAAQWILCVGMLLGRLEIIAAFVILQPFFWKQ